MSETFSINTPNTSREPFYPNQIIPLLLTVIVFIWGMALIWFIIDILNTYLPGDALISLELRWTDILVGLTIYLKTSIDFAIFIGRLMDSYPGWKNRILIESGTALGNIAGTVIVLILWSIFKEIKLVLALMIIIAGLVLLRLAEDGFEHLDPESQNPLVRIGKQVERLLQKINHIFHPLLSRLIPNMNSSKDLKTTPLGLLMLAFSVPFILGLDDFAGYVPLFNVINVYGFATGVFAGHMILNLALFISPKNTINLVRNPIISFIGSLVFIGLAIWSFYEGFHLLFGSP